MNTQTIIDKDPDPIDTPGETPMENRGSLDALQNVNDNLQQDVRELVMKKDIEAATTNPPSKEQYPTHARLKEIKDAIHQREGDIGELKISKVPEKQKGDFSIIIPSLKEPRDGEDKGTAMQRYIKSDLPRIASNLAVALPHVEFSVVGMYLNLSFKRPEFVGDLFSTVENLGNDFGNSDVNRGRRVVLDYSSPNTAKTMHVGHLRSTVIGEIMNRLMQSTGAITYGINHIGDWGTQFGQLVVACELWGEEVKSEVDPDKEPVKYLSTLYQKIKAAIKAEENEGKSDLADSGRAKFAALEKGDAETVKLWQEFRRLSLIEFKSMYERLGIRGLDLVLGESFYEDKMAGPEEDAINLGIVEEGKGGALILKFNTPIDFDKAVHEGLIEYSEEAGTFVLNPDNLNFSGLEALNKGNPDADIGINCFWKVKPARLVNLGFPEPKGKGETPLKVVGNLSLRDALANKLVTVRVTGEEKATEEKKQPITLAIAEKAGMLKTTDGVKGLMTEALPSCIFRTTDGRSVYITRDAAAIRHRREHFKATDILYVIGNEQALHLTQLFEMARRIGDIEGDEAQHVAFGMMKTKGGGKISSREGAGGLSEFLDELTAAAEKIVRKRESMVATSSDEDIRKTAEQIAIGALIFSNVRQDIARDLEFDPEAMMQFEGQTGPYIQYTCVRINSMLTKFGTEVYDSPSDLAGIEIQDNEYKLVKALAEFVDVVESAANKKSPHFLADYLLRLSADFNNLYSSGPKLRDLDNQKKKYYLKLYKSIHTVLQRGMELLNIPIPEKM